MTDTNRCVFFKRNTVHPLNFKPKSKGFYEYFKSTYYIPLIFGYSFLPFPIAKSKFIRIIFIFYALSISIGLSYLVLNYVKYIDRSPYVFVAVEYITTVTLLLFMNSNTRAQFIKKIELIDDKLHIDETYYSRVKKKTHIVIFIAIFTRILYSAALCFSFKAHCNESPMIIVITGFVLIAVDTNQIPRLIVFYLIKYRMTLLRKRVQYLLQKEVSIINANDKRRSLAAYQEVYENILDSINTIRRHINPFFLLSLVCSFPKIMLLLYNIIVLQQQGAPIIPLVVLALEALQWALIPCLPGIVFEMTRAQVEEMKQCLLQRQKHCHDYMFRTEIKDFLNYIELRPCRYYLYRLISVDITLPVSLFHLCTTYLIVMIQFSHLFEHND